MTDKIKILLELLEQYDPEAADRLWAAYEGSPTNDPELLEDVRDHLRAEGLDFA